LLTVNHRGVGHPAAVYHQGSWAIPGAEIPVDEALADHLIEHCSFLEADPDAHMMEHSGELQLPFLHHRNPNVRIVPIALCHLRQDDAITLGHQLHEALKDKAPDALWVASSDMNHFEDDALSREKDGKAIERALALDPAGLYQTVADEGISMCGVVPATVMLTAAVERGVKEAELVRYANSGEITGDRSSVVGYAGLTFDRPAKA
jgi:AmmeMemoRadiSam system protein B